MILLGLIGVENCQLKQYGLKLAAERHLPTQESCGHRLLDLQKFLLERVADETEMADSIGPHVSTDDKH